MLLQEMLSEMHDKLSQAVRLYDQLLTEQISQPTWRMTSAPHQPYNRMPSRYHSADSSTRREFREWQQPVSSPQPSKQRYETIEYHPTYVSPPVQNHLPPQHQPSYRSEHRRTNTHAELPPPVQVPDSHQQSSAPLGPSDHEPYAQQQPWIQRSFSETPTPQRRQTYEPPTPTQEQWPQSQPYQPQHTAIGQSQPPQSHSYLHQISTSPVVSHQQPSSQHLPPVSPTPVIQHQYAPTAPQPVQSVQSTPAQSQQSYYQSALSSTLSRHNSLSNSSYASTAPTSSSMTLGRSHTIASHSQAPHAYVSHPGTSNPLPAFPTAPTSNPQMFTIYSPPTTGLEQTEKKEVALIDL